MSALWTCENCGRRNSPDDTPEAATICPMCFHERGKPLYTIEGIRERAEQGFMLEARGVRFLLERLTEVKRKEAAG